jgi:hypothetical protein
MKERSQHILLLTLFIWNCFLSFSQTVQFEDLIIDGHKLKIDNITWKFQKGDLKLSTTDVADSATVVDLLVKIEKENRGFRIPTSIDLINFYSGEIVLPQRKTTCEKSFECKDVWMIGLSIPADLANNIFHEKIRPIIFKHHHKCSNCSDWTKEYKMKVGCHVCKDKREVYCNEVISCPVCNGTGTRIVTSKSVSVFEAFKKRENFVVFYFDSATDFGLFDVLTSKKIPLSKNSGDFGLMILEGENNIEKKLTEHASLKLDDSNIYGIILDLIKAEKIVEAQNKISELNFPASFPYYYNLKAKEDSILISKINLDLKNGDPIEASFKFKQLNIKYKDYYQIKNEIEKNFIKKYADEVRKADDETVRNFIRNNKDSLKKIELVSSNRDLKSPSYEKLQFKKYKVTINKDGSINSDLPIATNNTNLNPEKIIHNGFVIPVQTEFTLDITMEIRKVFVSDSLRYLISDKNTNKKLYKSLFGKLYFGTWGTPIFSEEINDYVFMGDNMIGNEIEIDRLYDYKEFVNNIKIDEGRDYVFEEYVKAKRGTFRRIRRTVMVSALAFFGGLRVYEYLKIP